MNFNSLFNISNNSLKFRNGFLKCQIVIAVSIKTSADRYVLTEQFSILKEYMKPPHDICNNICITVTKSNLPSLKILGLLKSYEEWKWKIFFHITQDFSQIKLCVCVCDNFVIDFSGFLFIVISPSGLWTIKRARTNLLG